MLDGVVHGSVGPSQGQNGFGFDMVFTPMVKRKLLAQMSPEGKDSVSHRGLAAKKLFARLERL